ncbi:hypothetical protein [Nocardioides sp. SYSU D00038]|uniref:hypothetical protein n=1 Tax=Nocardioides sp. SYSU D00038 TaxID=2812554 RepID=UPI00196883C6|nr:hypothetical protein [Nocardioides sp. SYSU D00038]
MADRVYVHVGAPKTGTTYVQDRLHLNRTRLARHGVRYPVGSHEDMFPAALDLIDRPWGGMRPEVQGEWAALAKRVARAKGTVVISHEILAGATPAQVERAMADLAPAEVHVVYSARDIARQVAAEWQEQVKHQRRVTFRSFLKQLQASDSRKASRWFWRVQGLPDVLERWSANLLPSQVHLVTVPQPGARHGELWRRFCTATGIDPAWAPLDSERRNPSLGGAETTLVRRLNSRLREAGIEPADYRTIVRHVVVHETLAQRDGMTRVVLPPEAHAWASGVAQHWIDWAAGSGIDVVGDLEELRPARPDPEAVWHNPDKPPARDVASAALDALVAVVLEAGRRPEPQEQVTARVRRAARRVLPR